MVLHARVILDLCEKLEHEISFEQVEGDFDSFKGKWLLEQLGNQHTLLKYSVESKMHKNAFLSEAIMEEVSKDLVIYQLHLYIFGDNPSVNLIFRKGQSFSNI